MAVDRRKKNGNWSVAEADGSIPTWERVNTAVLMDIRDELQGLNAKLGCWRIQRMFQTIERLDRRFAKKRSLRRKAA